MPISEPPFIIKPLNIGCAECCESSDVIEGGTPCGGCVGGDSLARCWQVVITGIASDPEADCPNLNVIGTVAKLSTCNTVHYNVVNPTPEYLLECIRCGSPFPQPIANPLTRFLGYNRLNDRFELRHVIQTSGSPLPIVIPRYTLDSASFKCSGVNILNKLATDFETGCIFPATIEIRSIPCEQVVFVPPS